MDELELSIDYIAGLIDGIGRIRFDIQQSSARSIGYDVRPRLILHVRNNDYLDGILGEFFDRYGITYSFRREDSESRFMRVGDNDSFRKLYQILDGYSIQLVRELAFLVESYLPAKQSSELADRRGHLRLIKAIYDLQPGRAKNDNTIYTPSFFADEFSLELASVSRLEIPDIEYRTEISTEYISGFFDGRGWMTIAIREDEVYSTGYALDLRVAFTRPWPNPNLTTALSNFLLEYGIQALTHNEENKIEIVIRRFEDVVRFIKLIEPELFARLEDCHYYYQYVLMRYQQNDHHTKQGFYEIVKASERLFRVTEDRRKYDAKYFEDVWEGEIVPRDLASILEDPHRESDRIAESETYLSGVSIETTRRRSDPEFRQAVISRFDGQCVITGIDDQRLLEAAHIVPWAEEREIGRDPANALLLNPLHHEAFDRALFLIDDNYCVHVAPMLETESSYLQENLIGLGGMILDLPSEDGPTPEYLRQRNEQVSWWNQ